MNPRDNLITKTLGNIYNTAKQRFGQAVQNTYDDKGFYQQGRFTTQPIQQAVNNRVIQPTINRLQQSPTLAKIQTSIPSPVNKFSEGFSEGSSMNLIDVPYRTSQNNLERGAYVGGQVASYLNPFNPVNKLSVFSGVGSKIANPLLKKVTQPLLRKGATALVGETAESIGYAGLNELSQQKGLTPQADQNIALDVGLGLGLRGLQKFIPQGTKLRAKGSVGNRPNNINPEDLGVADRIKDFFRSANKDTNSQSFRDAQNIIDDLAGKYLTKQEIDKVVAKGAKSNTKFYEQLNDAIRAKFKNADANYSYADNLALGITDQKMTKEQAKAKLPDIMYETRQDRVKANPKYNYDDVLKSAKKEIGSRDDKSFNLSEKFDEVYTDWVDRFYPVTKMVEGIEEKGKLKIRPEFNPSYQVKRLMGAGGTAELRHKRTLEPIIKQLGDVDRSDFDVFMKAQRDIELSGRGIKGSDAEVAQQRLDALSQKYDINNLSKVADQLYQYQRQGLEKLREAGFLSDEAVSNITAKNQKYVPFQRISDELDNFLGIPTQKLQQSSSPVKKIKGSDKAIESPLESIIANTYKVESAIAKNNVAKSIVNLGNIDPMYKNVFEKAKGSGNDVITVWENGQKQYYKAPEQIVKVVKGLNEENMGSVLKVLSAPASFFRAQTTGRNPAFFIPNAVRDQFDAALNTKYGYVPFVDYLNGLGHLINDRRSPGGDPLVREWYESGGSIFFENMGGRKDIRKQIQDATQRKPLIQKAIDAFVTGIDIAGEFSEKPTRIGIYKRARQATNNPLIAAYESREGTLDFARMGAKMKIANSLVPFLNVSIQGFDKMLRSAVDHPGRTAVVMAGTALLPQTLISLYNNQFHKEDYAQVPDFEKQGNFILLTGNYDREGNPIYYKIPLGHTQSILTQPTDQFITWLAGNNPQKFSQLTLSMLTGALPVIGEGDNLGEIASRTLGGNLPQFMKPAVEGMFNYDSFRNKPIVDPYTGQLPPAAQFYPSTPEEYKKIGRQFNMSPARIQHVAEGYGGGLSKEVGNARSTIQDIMAGNPLDPNKIPLVRRFRGSYSGFDTERGEEQVDTDKAVQDRQAKQDLRNSDKTTLRVGNTLYKKKTDKDGKIRIEKKELGGAGEQEDTLTKQGLFDNLLKPAEKFEPKPDYKDQAKEYLEYNEINIEVPTDPLKKAVYQKEKLSDAKKVFKDEDIEPALKSEILKQMGYKEADVRYEIATTLNNDEKALYMAERMKKMDAKRAVQFLEDSRTKSLSGDFLATKDVLKKLVDAGIINEKDMDYLLSFEKDQVTKQKVSDKKKSGGRKLRIAKVKIPAFSTTQLRKIKIRKPQLKKVRLRESRDLKKQDTK